MAQLGSSEGRLHHILTIPSLWYLSRLYPGSLHRIKYPKLVHQLSGREVICQKAERNEKRFTGFFWDASSPAIARTSATDSFLETMNPMDFADWTAD